MQFHLNKKLFESGPVVRNVHVGTQYVSVNSGHLRPYRLGCQSLNQLLLD